MSIRNTLDQIKSKANWLRSDAAEVINYVRMLPARRSFETMAQDALATAEHELIAALETVRAARKQYDNLRIDDKAA